jgi:hypothetical protein
MKQFKEMFPNIECTHREPGRMKAFRDSTSEQNDVQGENNFRRA